MDDSLKLIKEAMASQAGFDQFLGILIPQTLSVIDKDISFERLNDEEYVKTLIPFIKESYFQFFKSKEILPMHLLPDLTDNMIKIYLISQYNNLTR